MSIKAIFYTRFHDTKGSIVLHEVPPGSVTGTTSSTILSPTQHLANNDISPVSSAPDDFPLFDFTSIANLLIPKPEFCDRLVTVCINKHRIVGHPVCIQNDRYERNKFTFNLAVVLDEDAEFSAYTSVVRKLARVLKQLEEQKGFLSREEKAGVGVGLVDEDLGGRGAPSVDGSIGELETLPMLDEMVESSSSRALTPDVNAFGGTGLNELLTGSGLLDAFEKQTGKKVYALCEMIMEDLNNYCECMIPVDSSNTINLKLFPTQPPPAPVYAWHVPLATVDLPTVASSSDLTLTRITPYIDGVASVAQIAQLADTDLGLTRKACQHLLYYGCIILLDLFQFGAIYAPTAEIGNFVEDHEAQEEAVRYVCMGTYRRLHGTEANLGREEWGWRSQEIGIDRAKLVAMYTSLRHGQTLRHWCTDNSMLLSGIDVRRFITFGIIKGFLYRVHKYVITAGSGFGSAEPSNAHVRHTIAHDEIPERDGIDRHPTTRPSMEKKYSGRYQLDRHALEQHQQHYSSQHLEHAGSHNSRRASIAASSVNMELPLAKYLDGMHCLDEVCTELQMSEKRVLEQMRAAYGDVQIIHR